MGLLHYKWFPIFVIPEFEIPKFVILMVVKDLFVPVRHERRNSDVLCFSVLCEISSWVIGFKGTCTQESLLSLWSRIFFNSVNLTCWTINWLQQKTTTLSWNTTVNYSYNQPHISALNKAIIGLHIRVTKETSTAVTCAS